MSAESPTRPAFREHRPAGLPSVASWALGCGLALAGSGTWVRRADAQACCAGANVVTPARLDVHDDALVGARERHSMSLGSYDRRGSFVPTPDGTFEAILYHELFAAIRVVPRGQVSLLLPFVETYRRTRGGSEIGFGVGDLNVAARYDVVRTGESRRVPGIGILGGFTIPTGVATEAANEPLATDATGLGAVQGHLGLALEQSFGPWLFGVSALVAMRANRSFHGVSSSLSPEVSVLGSAAHTWASGAALGLALTYAQEGDARIDGKTVTDSGRRLVTASLAAGAPLTESSRSIASVWITPPLSSFGLNQPATVGASLGFTWSFR